MASPIQHMCCWGVFYSIHNWYILLVEWPPSMTLFYELSIAQAQCYRVSLHQPCLSSNRLSCSHVGKLHGGHQERSFYKTRKVKRYLLPWYAVVCLSRSLRGWQTICSFNLNIPSFFEPHILLYKANPCVLFLSLFPPPRYTRQGIQENNKKG